MKQKLLLAMALLLLCAGCGKSRQSAETPPSDPLASFDVDAEAYPVVTGRAFGLSGEDAALYTAVAEYLGPLYIPTDLMIPSLTVYGTYQDDAGNNQYVCGLLRTCYYDLNLDDPEHPSMSGSGSAGTLARVTLSGDGICTDIQETYDGADAEETAQRIRELCGPLTELADTLSRGGNPEGRDLPDLDTPEELLAAYARYYFS